MRPPDGRICGRTASAIETTRVSIRSDAISGQQIAPALRFRTADDASPIEWIALGKGSHSAVERSMLSDLGALKHQEPISSSTSGFVKNTSACGLCSPACGVTARPR